ncbi:MAG TPA: cytochrome c, partial [Bacteroidia bacterium]|nr:cytochrome c [Bacteroidia bacterium]
MQLKKNRAISFVISLGLILLAFSCNNGEIKENAVKKQGVITYADNISTILFKNCASCHRPNQAGPFNLLTYADAKRNANKIKFVTQTRYMPPWPADAAYTHFVDERILSADDIEQIKTWVDNGCLSGDTTKVKAPV